MIFNPYLFIRGLLCTFICSVSIFSQETQLWELFDKTEEYYNAGNYSESIQFAKKTLTIAKDKFGSEHPYVAISLNNLANIYRVKGDSVNAKNYFDQAIIMTEKSIGKKTEQIKKVLSLTTEVAQHNMNGATGNVVYLHKDGNHEAVFDKDGNAVKYPANQANLNMAHPVNEPFKHYKYDTWPWVKYGNSRDDPTTKPERLTAFHKDLLDGFKKLSK